MLVVTVRSYICIYNCIYLYLYLSISVSHFARISLNKQISQTSHTFSARFLVVKLEVL